MKRGRPTSQADDRRDGVEAALFALSAVLDLHGEVELRIRQAMRRTPLVADVLNPALERMQAAQRQVRQVQTEIREIWQLGQSRRWRDDRSGDV